MTRSPQPMRRMRYIIGELQRLDITGGYYPYVWDEAQRWLGGEEVGCFHIAISHDEGQWFVALEIGLYETSSLLKMPILTAPGPETVWIGPDLRPVVIQPRATTLTEAELAERFCK